MSGKGKRILLFVPTLSCGGAERVAILLAQGLQRLGYVPRIVTASKSGEFLPFVDERIEIIDLDSGKPIRGIGALARQIGAFGADAVIAFGMHTGIAAAISRKLYGWSSPLLIRNENNLEFDWRRSGPLNRFLGPVLSRWAARQATVIAVSEALRLPTARYLGQSPTRIVTIRNPVFDVLPILSDLPREEDLHPWLREKCIPTFVAAGRLEWQKGFDTLIAAFHLLRSQIAARLVIFGVGSLRSELQDQIDALGLADCVVLAGFTPKPMEQMRAATAFVLSSRFEGFGLVLVEALAAGTLIISTDCDYGPNEILERGRYGTLVPTDAPKELAMAMMQVAQGMATTSSPSEEWFLPFLAEEAARLHVELLDAPTSSLMHDVREAAR